jgi:hypothetical protein
MLIMAFVLSSVTPASAAPSTTLTGNVWVDAQAGNDANNGLSATSAFRTIQAAARVAGAGATVHILPGVYRESVVPAYDGGASAPITYVSQNGPGTVKIRGSAASSSLSWTRLASNTIGLPSGVNPGNIYYANLSSWGLREPPRFVVQLDAQGNVTSRFMPAREPDALVRTDWKSSEFWWMANGGSAVASCDPVTNANHNCDVSSRSFTKLTDTTSDSAPSGIEPGNLTTLRNLTGATLVAMDARHGHYVYHSLITAHDVAAGRVTVGDSLDEDGVGGLGWGSKYYVENHPALLDQPGEWWFNVATGNLYIWAPNGSSPSQLSIEISRLSTGFNLTNRSYIALDGLTIEFYNGKAYTISNSNSRYKAFGDAIRNSTIRYASMGIVLYQYMDSQTPPTYAVDGFVLEGSEVGYMDTSAISATYWWPSAPSPTYFNHSGVRNTVIRNNNLHDLGFNSEERSAVGVRFDFPDRLQFTGNQVQAVAHLGVYLYQSLIQSSRQWGFSPSEIKIGNILVADNLIDKACMQGSDCGALKLGGRSRPTTHVFRDVLITGNVLRNTYGWSSVSILRGGNLIGDGNGFYLDYASGVHLYRNIIYNNTGAGVKLSCLWRDGDGLFYNNVVANNFKFGFKMTAGETCDNHNGSVNTQLVDNVLINNEGFAFRLESSYNTANFGNLVIDRNLYFQNGWNSDAGWGNPANLQLYQGSGSGQYFHTLGEIQSGTPWENNGVEGDPAFASYNPADHNRYDGSWPDFHLTADSSLAIDHGTATLPGTLATLLASYNLADAPAGSAFDIGRYESQVSAVVTAQVHINGTPVGNYELPAGSSAPHAYPGLQSGPVQVHSSRAVLASERGTFGPYNTFNEVMGYPNNQLTTHYWFPWYDNVHMITWVLVGNPSATQTATVTIKIAGSTVYTASIPPLGNVTPTFSGVENGPVEVLSNINVFASQRVLMGYPDGAQSFDEVLGYPHAQLTTHYWFTWYDDKDMSTDIMIGNPSASATASVTIKIAGATRGTYSVAPLRTLRLTYAGVQNGPVEVIANRNVFASERGMFGPAGTETFNEVIGFPHDQLTNNYWFPWYDNANMITWVLVGNPSSSSTANVTIKIAGQTVGIYAIPPYGNVTPTFAGEPNGPVQVISNINVFTSERALKGYPGTGASFNEILGIANGKLTTDYWFTWYDNKDMSTDILLGRP